MQSDMGKSDVESHRPFQDVVYNILLDIGRWQSWAPSARAAFLGAAAFAMLERFGISKRIFKHFKLCRDSP